MPCKAFNNDSFACAYSHLIFVLRADKDKRSPFDPSYQEEKGRIKNLGRKVGKSLYFQTNEQTNAAPNTPGGNGWMMVEAL